MFRFPPLIVLFCSLLLPPLAAAERQFSSYSLPGEGNSLVGSERTIELSRDDTLVDVALRFALGYQELRLANPEVDPWLPVEGERALLPDRRLLPNAPREGIVLNLPEMRLYYYPADDPDTLWTFPMGIGREGWQTPTGTTELVRKASNPPWFPPASIQEDRKARGLEPHPDRVPPGPDNPLGSHALYLGFPGYLIHGTNQPSGIGLQVSHGCIRLHPDDISRLFDAAPVGTPVHIVDQPVKAGWHDGVLYLEAHPSLPDSNPEEEGSGTVTDATAMVRAIIRVTDEGQEYDIDWDRARAVVQSADGRPHAVGKALDDQALPTTP